MIHFDDFLDLSTLEVADLMRQKGSTTGVIFLDGSRRWFILENGQRLKSDWAKLYAKTAIQKHIDVFKMCFEHGMQTIVTPTLYPKLLNRGDHYREVIQSLGFLATYPDLLSFYEKEGVRVRFFGDYRQRFLGTPLEVLCDQFDELTRKTLKNDRYRLFYGVFTSDAGESVQDIARLSVEYFQRTGKIPNRQELIGLYYGEEIQPVRLAISFEVNALEYPLLNGGEDLYFTVTPSMYLDKPLLRQILFDHLYLRGQDEADYQQVSDQSFLALKKFYKAHQLSALGCGQLIGGVWVPQI